MSFTIKIKEEISTIKSTKSEIIAELSAYLKNNGIFQDNEVILNTENQFLIDRISNHIKTITNISPEVKTIENQNFSKRKLYQITIEKDVNNLLKTLGILDEKNHFMETVPTYIVGANEEIRAYLRGAFFAAGSINDPKTSRYHMEILVSTPKEAIFVQKLLNIFELNAKILNRDKGYMIYIKEAEKISDFIRILGANKAVMYFENVRVYRDQKNKTNRLNNMEQANMDRAFETANEQLKQIKIIEDNNGIDLLDERTKVAVTYRKEYPETSSRELAEIITLETGKKLSKSGLNHRFRKVKELAESFEKMRRRNKKQQN